MALEGRDGVERLSFDLPGRRLTALHRGEAVTLAARLRPLGLGARLVETGPAAHAEAAGADASAAVTSSVRAELDASDPAWTQFAATDASETGTLRVLLVANAACLVLVFRHRYGGAHMKASYIFTANDVLGNLGVIAAGALVGWTASPVPDLVVGSLIASIVLVGAVRILRLR